MLTYISCSSQFPFRLHTHLLYLAHCVPMLYHLQQLLVLSVQLSIVKDDSYLGNKGVRPRDFVEGKRNLASYYRAIASLNCAAESFDSRGASSGLVVDGNS